MRINYENWLTYIVLSLCATLFVLGLISGALNKG
jgi:hypothetical protein